MDSNAEHILLRVKTDVETRARRLVSADDKDNGNNVKADVRRKWWDGQSFRTSFLIMERR